MVGYESTSSLNLDTPLSAQNQLSIRSWHKLALMIRLFEILEAPKVLQNRKESKKEMTIES